jgi:hypothetical protein
MRLPQLSTTERRCGSWIGFEVDAVGINDLLGEGVRDDLRSLPRFRTLLFLMSKFLLGWLPLAPKRALSLAQDVRERGSN